MASFGAMKRAPAPMQKPAMGANKPPGMMGLGPSAKMAPPPPKMAQGMAGAVGGMMKQPQMNTSMNTPYGPPPSNQMGQMAQAGANIGNAFLQNRSAQMQPQMREVPQGMIGPGNNGIGQYGISDNPQPMNEAQSLKPNVMQQAPDQLSAIQSMYGGDGQEGPKQAMQDMSQLYGGDAGIRQAEGIGPSPQVAPPPPQQQMNRRPMMGRRR